MEDNSIEDSAAESDASDDDDDDDEEVLMKGSASESGIDASEEGQ